MNSKTKYLGSIKPLAIKLRKEGKTFTEIQEELGAIAKGTLSGWVKHVELTPAQKRRIRHVMAEKGHSGRLKGAWTNHEKRINRIADIRRAAESEYDEHTKSSLFLPGLVLYLAEGTRKWERFMFMNSEVELIKIMVKWVESVAGYEANELCYRLYIHWPYANENCEQFWQSQLKVSPDQFLKTVYKPTVREYKKNPRYKGCLRVEVPGSELYWKVIAWRDCLYRTIE